MAEGGFDESTPLLSETGKGDDDDAAPTAAAPTGGNVSMGFDPGANSTPAPRHTRMNTPGERPSFDELLPDTPGLSTTFTAENELYKEFPFAEKYKLKFKMENDRLKVGLIAPKKPYYTLTTKVQGKEEYQINKSLPREVLKVLGNSRRDIIAEKMQQLTEKIADYKKRADDPNENIIERKKASEYASQKLNERTDLRKELDRLKNGDYQTSENIEMYTFNENEAARQQREEEIQSEREKKQCNLECRK